MTQRDSSAPAGLPAFDYPGYPSAAGVFSDGRR